MKFNRHVKERHSLVLLSEPIHLSDVCHKCKMSLAITQSCFTLVTHFTHNLCTSPTRIGFIWAFVSSFLVVNNMRINPRLILNTFSQGGFLNTCGVESKLLLASVIFSSWFTWATANLRQCRTRRPRRSARFFVRVRKLILVAKTVMRFSGKSLPMSLIVFVLIDLNFSGNNFVDAEIEKVPSEEFFE